MTQNDPNDSETQKMILMTTRLSPDFDFVTGIPNFCFCLFYNIIDKQDAHELIASFGYHAVVSETPSLCRKKWPKFYFNTQKQN